MTDRQFYIYTAGVTVFALFLRTAYQLGADPLVHIAGDINDYVRYAWNLGQHGIYSSAAIDPDTVPTGDRFRPPGFPLFLLLAMKLSNFESEWVSVAYALQIAFSTATVSLTTLLAREWIRPGFALLAGVLVALWPHHIVFASTLLSETLLGFSIIAGLWLSSLSCRRKSWPLAALTGAVFGFAALVNSLMLLFPIVITLLLFTQKQRRSSAILLSTFIIVVGAWSLASPENTSGRTSTHRATINLVQGSWPIYHAAWQARDHHDEARQILDAIHAEIDVFSDSPQDGVKAIGQRLSRDPIGYARWYLLEKPYLLWDWDIRLGWGGAHFLPVGETPLEKHSVLRGSYLALKFLNPLFFSLSLGAITVVISSLFKGKQMNFTGLSVAAFAIYVTALHTLLQAEPRYSIAYRPEQMILAAAMLSFLWNQVRPRISRKLSSSSNIASNAAPVTRHHDRNYS